MNYRIESTGHRWHGRKNWTVVTNGYRYNNIEAAEAHLTYLRFNNRKTEYVIRKDEGWDGPVRAGFKADDVKAVLPPTPGFYMPTEAIAHDVLNVEFHTAPRGRRPRNGNP